MLNITSLKRPANLVILTDIFAFSLLCFYRNSLDWYMLAAGLLVVALIAVTTVLISKKLHGDEYLFLIVALLASLGFIMIYRLDRIPGLKQVVWFAGGIVLYFISCWLFKRFRHFDRFLLYYLATALLLFTATLLMGRNINGSMNWLSIAGFSFQPAEPIKVLFILILSCCFGGTEQLVYGKLNLKIGTEGNTGKLLATCITYIFIGFLIAQKEWGTSIVLFFTYISLIYVFEKDVKLYIFNAIFALAACFGGYFFFGHIRTRVDMWLNPWIDIDGKGYQIIQSLFAIASGGFFGTGVGLGKPDLIPAVKTDFIFSAICEEMGMFGGMAVILLFFLLCYRGFKIVLTTHNSFDKAAALGITVMFGIQTFTIIGGVIKMIPMTGITLPFISYGGSSLTSSFVALGILQAISAGTEREVGGDEDETEKHE